MKSFPQSSAKTLMVMGGDGDGSIPYQWHIFFNQHGMKTTCLALSDFSGERHKFLASLFRLALSGRFLSYHLNHTFPVICAAIIRVLHPRSNIVVSFHRSYRHMDFFAKASHLIGLIFATCITCNSNATLDSLPRLARKFRKCIVVYNGISLEEFELFDRNYAGKIAPGPTVRLVAVGRLVPEKNFLSLVEAIKIVFDNGPDVNLILDIYGEGPLFNDLVDLIALYDLSCRVRLRGFIARERLYREVHASDGLVVCSYTEGFCNAAVEAMALGSPVIYTPIDALLEVVGPAGFCIEGFSSVEIARGICGFLKVSLNEKVDRVQQARLRARDRFSMAATADSFSRLYSRLYFE